MKQVSIPYGLEISFSQIADGDMKDPEQLKKIIAQLPFQPRILKLKHGTIIQRATDGSNLEGDVIIAKGAEQAVGFIVGDCLPVVIVDTQQKILALIHAGWKSLSLDIVKKTVEHLVAEYKSDISNLVGFIGPGICKQHYLHTQPPQQIEDLAWQPFITKEDLYHVDLKGFITTQLNAQNIFLITDSNICTFEPENQLFSHHRALETGETDGRFLVAAWMK